MNDPSSTLVFGASGFLGAHVAAQAVKLAREEATFADPLGPAVFGTARKPDAAPSFCEPRDAVGWVETDLAREGSPLAVLESTSPGQVILCAALSRVGDCSADPALADRMNRGVPAEVAEWCQRSGARFVHVSTDMVFGGADAPSGGLLEGNPVAPLNVYGESKAAGERAVLEACPEALVVRLPLLYGNSAGRGLGASDSLLESVASESVPTLFTDEWRTPLEVSNAAAALVELLGTEASGILHVAGPDRVSRYELALAVLGAMGLPPSEASAMIAGEVSEGAAQGTRPRDVSLDITRACAVLETELLGVRMGTERAVR